MLYRWKVKTELEARFIDAWSAATVAYRTIGALGSRLHRADDGSLYAYAEWPSRNAWEDARGRSPIDEATGAVMREATLEFEMLPLEPLADLLARTDG